MLNDSMHKFAQKAAIADANNLQEQEKESAGTKTVRALRAARRDFLDTAMYFSIGALITAAFSTQFDQTNPNLIALAENECLSNEQERNLIG